MADRIRAWLLSLDYPQRRALVGVGALVVVLALVLGIAVLVDDGDGGDDTVALETDDRSSTTSTTDPDDTTTSASIDLVDGSSTTLDPTTASTNRTSTTKKGATSTTRRGTSTTKKGGGGGGSSTTSTTQATSTTTTGVSADNGSATAASNLFAQYRADNSKPSMARSGALDAKAFERAKRMAEDHQLQHYPGESEDVFGACGSCTGWAANVGYSTEGAAQVWQGWLNSPPHKEHLDDPRGGVFGMGAYRSADGYLWVVHLFGYTG